MAHFLDFTEEVPLSLSTEVVPGKSLVMVDLESDVGVRDFSIKMSLS